MGSILKLFGSVRESIEVRQLRAIRAKYLGGPGLDEVEVHVQLETRGPAHADQVLARLRERGYRVLE